MFYISFFGEKINSPPDPTRPEKPEIPETRNLAGFDINYRGSGPDSFPRNPIGFATLGPDPPRPMHTPKSESAQGEAAAGMGRGRGGGRGMRRR